MITQQVGKDESITSIQAVERGESINNANQNRYKHRSLEFWKCEIAAAILSLVSLAIVVWILTKIDGTPLADWRYLVSPNAFLSIFITIAKTGTAFCLTTAFAQLCWLFFLTNSQKVTHIDNFASAREGPYGSLMLLFKLEIWGKIPTVARLGALTALLAVVMDPFAQQILRFEPRQMVVSENSTWVPTTSSYSSGTSLLANSALQQGLFGALLGIDTPMRYTCATGNCTYPDFLSLGFCSQCLDIDQDIAPQCTSGQSNTDRGCSSIRYDLPAHNLSLTLQNGSLASDYTQKPSGTFSFVKTSMSNARPHGPQNMTLFDFVIAQLRVNQTQPNITLSSPPSWNVSACAISWCGKLYQNLSTINGVLQNATPKEFILKPDPASNCWQSGTCQEFLLANTSDIPPELVRPFKAVADPFRIRNLLNIDAEVLVTNGTFPLSNANTIANSMLWDVDISQAMKRVTKSMTDYIRTFINPEQIHGSAYQFKVYMKVQWGWIVLPCIVTLLGIVFMMIVMWLTSADEGVTWKASSVPLVISGLKDNTDDGLRRQDSQPVSGLASEAEAEKVRVQLTRDDNGQFKFRRTGGLLDDTDAR